MKITKKMLEEMKKEYPRMIILEKRNELGIATGEAIGVKFVSMPNGNTELQFIGDEDIDPKDVLEVVEMMKNVITEVNGECRVVKEGWQNLKYQKYQK